MKGFRTINFNSLLIVTAQQSIIIKIKSWKILFVERNGTNNNLFYSKIYTTKGIYLILLSQLYTQYKC